METATKTQCEEKVYAGSMQYDEIHGHQCRNEAKVGVKTSPRAETVLHLCKRHAAKYLRQGWVEV